MRCTWHNNARVAPQLRHQLFIMMQTEQEVAEIVNRKVRQAANTRAMQDIRKLVEGVRREEELEARAVRRLGILFVAIVVAGAIVITVKWRPAQEVNRNLSAVRTYAAAVLSQVEHYANTDYQAKSKSVKATGQVALELSIDAARRLKSVKVVRSSGNIDLDNMAKDVVEMSGAFPPFPDEMKKDTDIVEITRTFSFVNNGLSAR